MNSIVLSGNIVATPILNEGKKPYTRFRLAVKRKFTQDKTDFFNILAYDKQAELICSHVEKGSMVIIQGSLIMTEYVDKEGVTRVQTTVVVEQCDFVRKPQPQSGLIEDEESVSAELPF